MQRLVNLLGVTALAANDRMTASVAGTGARSRSDAAALAHLVAHPGEPVEALAPVLGLSQPGAVAVVGRLVGDGLVESRAGPDKRTRALHLSAAGERAARGVLDARAEALAGLLAPLSARERARLEGLLVRVVAHLADDRPGARAACRLCDRAACVEPGTPHSCPLQHTVAPPSGLSGGSGGAPAR